MQGRKQTANTPGKPGSSDVSHLDQQLTELTRAAVTQAKRWRNAIVAALALLVLGIAAYSIIGALAESQVRGINERLYRLIDSGAAQKDDYVIDKGEVNRLLEDVRGKRSEAYVLRRLADFHLGRAEQLTRKKDAPQVTAPGSLLPTNPPVSATDIDTHWEEALRLADQAAQRVPGDVDVVTWAARVKSRVEGERKKDWLPAGWKYKLPAPQLVPPDPQPPPAAPALPPTDAGQPPPAAPATPAEK